VIPWHNRKSTAGNPPPTVLAPVLDPTKQVFGGRLWARKHAKQRTEALVKCAVLNRMTQLGMPETVRIG